ncbi:porphobilinogen synthase [Thermincola ferriacetica]|uniref:Delta-aminolevulinic acid dehydratase n=1 Tax=Thermincola ferriacetica TaxID=281456 RepID=A0A0L6W678_9FIRM|nr:porphobilinogen synthase [Thermincola ferriacetica]KNZ71020.1 porphobilinogen synthase [Thermincola ferriacetica]
MAFPITRMRRLRVNEVMRRMVRENKLTVDDLIYPLFVTNGENVINPVASMPGIAQMSVDNILKECKEIVELGIPAVLLFGIPAYKDEIGSSAYDDEEAVQRAIRAIKKEYPDLLVIPDLCMCEYTSHGHCGILDEKGNVINDETLKVLAKIALSYARAGADMVAPSDMMDGRVGAIREALDTNGFENIPIMSYSAKYASAYYGPFRDVAESAPQFGDRRGYQMDPANGDEAIRETRLDVEEGADIIMVKPALAYMDIMYRLKQEFKMPLAAYNVSGEYSMIKAASQNGWIDEKRVVLETLTGMKRAGADIIITYHAKDVAKWLKEDK